METAFYFEYTADDEDEEGDGRYEGRYEVGKLDKKMPRSKKWNVVFPDGEWALDVKDKDYNDLWFFVQARLQPAPPARSKPSAAPPPARSPPSPPHSGGGESAAGSSAAGSSSASSSAAAGTSGSAAGSSSAGSSAAGGTSAVVSVYGCCTKDCEQNSSDWTCDNCHKKIHIVCQPCKSNSMGDSTTCCSECFAFLTGPSIGRGQRHKRKDEVGEQSLKKQKSHPFRRPPSPTGRYSGGGVGAAVPARTPPAPAAVPAKTPPAPAAVPAQTQPAPAAVPETAPAAFRYEPQPGDFPPGDIPAGYHRLDFDPALFVVGT